MKKTVERTGVGSPEQYKLRLYQFVEAIEFIDKPVTNLHRITLAQHSDDIEVPCNVSYYSDTIMVRPKKLLIGDVFTAGWYTATIYQIAPPPTKDEKPIEQPIKKEKTVEQPSKLLDTIKEQPTFIQKFKITSNTKEITIPTNSLFDIERTILSCNNVAIPHKVVPHNNFLKVYLNSTHCHYLPFGSYTLSVYECLPRIEQPCDV